MNEWLNRVGERPTRIVRTVSSTHVRFVILLLLLFVVLLAILQHSFIHCFWYYSFGGVEKKLAAPSLQLHATIDIGSSSSSLSYHTKEDRKNGPTEYGTVR